MKKQNQMSLFPQFDAASEVNVNAASEVNEQATEKTTPAQLFKELTAMPEAEAEAVMLGLSPKMQEAIAAQVAKNYRKHVARKKAEEAAQKAGDKIGKVFLKLRGINEYLGKDFKMTYKESPIGGIDSKALKRDLPEVAEAYANTATKMTFRVI